MPPTPPPPPSVDLDAAFAAVNKSRTGRIVASEVQAALASGGMVFSLQACGLMVRLHDADGDGAIDRPEFAALHATLDALSKAFAAAVGAGGGPTAELPVDRVGPVLASVGLDTAAALDPPALAAAVAAFDPDHDGALGLTEVVGLALFLKGADSAFRAFAGGGGGGGSSSGDGGGGGVTISLTRSQFVYAAASCR
jgi:hypothetical protein